MKMLGAGWLMLAALMLSAASWAQESPNELTPAETACRRRIGHATSSFGTDAVDCFIECQTSPSRRCDPRAPDPQTAACLDVARGRANARIANRCSGFACPDCYDGDCDDFVGAQFQQVQLDTGAAAVQMFCDDSFSVDGLSHAEATCQVGAAKAGARFSEALQRCLERCVGDVQGGRVDASACDPSQLDTALFDPRAQDCINHARARFGVRCATKCADTPECWTGGCSATGAFVEGSTLRVGGAVYCTDVPPPVCGDGRITGEEICDPASSPTGCPPGEDCFGCSLCFPAICGDGRISGDEQCDYNAFPSGCDPADLCTFDCQCVPPPVCGDGVLSELEPCDESATPTGCPSGSECIVCAFCQNLCGNGTLDPGEACDLGGSIGCPADSTCTGDCAACIACPAAVSVPPEGGTLEGDTSTGDNFTGGSCGGEFAPERFFTWTPSDSGVATASTCGSAFDTLLYVRDGSCGGSQLGCNDDSCGVGSRVSFAVVAGHTYTIVVDGFATQSGSFTLQVSPPGAPVCGDGVVSPGEECDPGAFPNGCADPLVCSNTCTCSAPPSFCVPRVTDTCSSGTTGCGELCDGSLGVCVSTAEGTPACVEPVCTFIDCDSSADCGSDAVCFTQGCCGAGFGAGKPWR